MTGPATISAPYHDEGTRQRRYTDTPWAVTVFDGKCSQTLRFKTKGEATAFVKTNTPKAHKRKGRNARAA